MEHPFTENEIGINHQVQMDLLMNFTKPFRQV